MSLAFGMQTLIELDSIDDHVAVCKNLGLGFIELNMNLPRYQLENIDEAMLMNAMQRDGIFFTIHLDENLNVCDFNRCIADGYVTTVLETIELAKRLNVPILNMHISEGVYFTLPAEKVYLFDKYRDIYMDSMKIFRDKCVNAIGNSGIKICIENCGGYENFAIDSINLLLESDCFGLTFDIGHSHSASDADQAFILQNADRLHHMHVHDAVSSRNHLVLGEGEIDIAARLRLATEHDCRCVVEVKTVEGLRRSMKYLREAVII